MPLLQEKDGWTTGLVCWLVANMQIPSRLGLLKQEKVYSEEIFLGDTTPECASIVCRIGNLVPHYPTHAAQDNWAGVVRHM